ncbi:MAG TPA: PAS domain-containing sensor histidine kinase [Beijerinckiaceae bacterium]|nr:PAS domain-containing sensor histidine kinase [Beijerinckiaceae bacterium]
MRINETISAIGARLSGLVHDSVRDDPLERCRHERFIASRMSVGMIALACLPLYLLLRGVPTAPEYAAMVCLVMPIAAAIVLSRGGRLALAHAISSASLAGLIVCIAATSGGVASAAAVWLVAVPLEALLSGSRQAALAGSAIAGIAVLLLGFLSVGGVLPPLEPWPMTVATPVFAITAIAHAATLALEHCRIEMSRRAFARSRDARDRSLLQAIDDLVTWHDRNGHVVKASAAATKLLGLAPAMLTGRGLLARVHVSDRPAFLKAISDAALSGEPVALEYRLHVGAADGSAGRVIWAETRARRIESHDGGKLGGHGDYAVVAVTRDISEHKRRTDELEGARLAAERADETKGRFLATVSHELRTPLNAIIGFSEMLAAQGTLEAASDRRREYAQIIHESGQHLLEVVNTLLDMSKIDSGNFDFVPEPFAVAPLVHGCCDLMQLKAEQAGIALARDVVGDLPELVADGRACRQILINLLSNAVKFTPRGGLVTVAARRRTDRIELTVADSGIGIGEQDLPRLGDPFFQAGSAYSRSHDGTGLGLSVVRGLVGLHKGELTIESALGEGTAVTVSLPIDCRNGGGRSGAAVRVHALPRRPAHGSTCERENQVA